MLPLWSLSMTSKASLHLSTSSSVKSKDSSSSKYLPASSLKFNSVIARAEVPNWLGSPLLREIGLQGFEGNGYKPSDEVGFGVYFGAEVWCSFKLIFNNLSIMGNIISSLNQTVSFKFMLNNNYIAS
ncbi:hypothetical protein FGO68_gene1289 [Halteria grandinella]|uniref:Uncharacterized protein n=1 Tax=Halteria grandinella TaxID=5974 RepID=A0A8J8NMI1_HALGN|nr:hypothetical protein FGO68_gene1289 [Halteria grandinella]